MVTWHSGCFTGCAHSVGTAHTIGQTFSVLAHLVPSELLSNSPNHKVAHNVKMRVPHIECVPDQNSGYPLFTTSLMYPVQSGLKECHA